MRLWTNEPLSRHTTFQIGGPADELAAPENEQELMALLAKKPAALIGAGYGLLTVLLSRLPDEHRAGGCPPMCSTGEWETIRRKCTISSNSIIKNRRLLSCGKQPATNILHLTAQKTPLSEAAADFADHTAPDPGKPDVHDCPE